MAGVDKLYGTQEQYIQFKNWLSENQKPMNVLIGWCSEEGDLFENALPTDYLYDTDGYDKNYRPLSNFPTAIDNWLKENCPLSFIQEQLSL